MSPHITLCLLLAILSISPTFGQRCGSFFAFRVLDGTSQPLASDLTMATVKWEGSMSSPILSLHSYDPTEPPFYSLDTGCGIRLWKMQMIKGEQVMQLSLKNIPLDTDFLMDAIPFQEGSFEIDFQDLEGAVENFHEGSYEWIWGYILSPSQHLRTSTAMVDSAFLSSQAFAFHFIDSSGETIDPTLPAFDDYTVEVHMLTNKNNEDYELFGSVDKGSVVSELERIWYQGKNYYYASWPDSFADAPQYVELIIRNGQDSMHLEFNCDLKNSLYLDSIPFRPGYDYMLYPYDAYQKEQYHASTKIHHTVFRARDFYVTEPLENYQTLKIRPGYRDSLLSFWIYSDDPSMHQGTAIQRSFSFDREKREVYLKLERIIPLKGPCYGIEFIPDPGYPETGIRLGHVAEGTYTLHCELAGKKEVYTFTVHKNYVDLQIDPSYTILKQDAAGINTRNYYMRQEAAEKKERKND
ncbi:MAG: hypothetical protein AAFO96_11620 [Bacteroidota bacterium]